MPIDKWKSGMT